MAKTLTGLTPSREQQYRARILERQARATEGRYAREIARAMRELAKASGNVGKQAAVMQSHREKLAALLDKQYVTAFDFFGGRVLSEAPKHHDHLLNTKDIISYDANRLAWITANVARKVTEISGTTKAQATSIIQSVLSEQVVAGAASQASTSAAIIAAMREKGGSLARYRSRVIARTEAHASAGAANEAAAASLGIPLKKEWVAARQAGRTRDDHLDADGQVVALDQPFIVGGERLMYPSDPSGSPENVINCRCSSVHIVIDD